MIRLKDKRKIYYLIIIFFFLISAQAKTIKSPSFSSKAKNDTVMIQKIDHQIEDNILKIKIYLSQPVTYLTYWIKRGRKLAIDLIGSNIIAQDKLEHKVNIEGIDKVYLKFYPGYEAKVNKSGKVDTIIVEMERENYYEVNLKSGYLEVLFPYLEITTKKVRQVERDEFTIPQRFSFSPEKLKGPVDKETLEKALLGWRPLLEIGAENYRPLEVAREQMELAQLKLREARRQLFPTAVIRWTNTTGTTVEDVGIFSKSYELEMEQPLTYGGELRFKIQQAKINLELARSEFERLYSDFALEVKRNYYNVILNRMNWDVFNQLLREAKKYLVLADVLLKKNLITELEYQQVESLNQQIKFLFISSQKELSLAELTLRQTLNLPPDEKLEIVNWLPFQKVNIDLNECLRLALKNRVELKITDLVTQFNALNEQIAKAKNRLRISLTGKAGRMAEDYETEPVVYRDSWYVGLKLSKPLGASTLNTSVIKQEIPLGTFRAGETSKTTTTALELNVLDRLAILSEEKAAQVELLKAVNESAETEDTVIADVERAYANYISSLFQIETSLKRMKFLKNRIRVTDARYKAGEAGLPELLQVRYDLANENITYNRALIGYYIALSSLSKACGVYSYLELATEKPVITAWEKFSQNPPLNLTYMPYQPQIFEKERTIKKTIATIEGQIIGVNNDYGIAIVNIGAQHGLSEVDEIKVLRNKKEIAILVPTKIESNITACRITSNKNFKRIGLMIGDKVEVRK